MKIIISTYSSLNQVYDYLTSRKFKVIIVLTMDQFFYCEPFLNRYKYRHQINGHNNCNH